VTDRRLPGHGRRMDRSLGGTLAVLAATKFPRQVKKLVLLAPAVMFAKPGHHLLPPEARQTLAIDGWGSVAFREGRYRFPSLWIRNRLYWRQLATLAGAGEWRVASRLCLAPAMVVATRRPSMSRGRHPASSMASRAAPAISSKWVSSVVGATGSSATPTTAASGVRTVDAVSVRRRRAAVDLAALRAWYGDTAICANQGIADYLAPTPPGAVPAGTCSSAPCRCSSHWSTDASGTMPAVFEAVVHPTPRPASASDDRLRRARLDRDIDRLLFDCPRGLGPSMIRLCLQGKDTYYDVNGRRLRPLRSELLYHRLFGSRPGLQAQAVLDSLARLDSIGTAVTDGFRWRSAARVAAQAAAAARSATAGAPGASAPGGARP